MQIPTLFKKKTTCTALKIKMIVFNKNATESKANSISPPVSKDKRRVRTTTIITKANKKFLRSLGFTV